MSTARVLNPIGRPKTGGIALAGRLDALSGVTLGLSDNQKPNAGLFLRFIGELARERDGAAAPLAVRKELTPNQPADYTTLEGSARAVVNAWGD